MGGFPIAGLVFIGMIWLVIGAIKNVSYLRQAAENPEEDDSDKEPVHSNGETK